MLRHVQFRHGLAGRSGCFTDRCGSERCGSERCGGRVPVRNVAVWSGTVWHGGQVYAGCGEIRHGWAV